MELLPLIIALAAVIMAYLAWKTSEEVAAVQIFLDLRKSYSEVLGQMDSRYHDGTWDPRAETNRSAMRTLEKYWLHTFTEWFATTKLNKGKFSYLWQDFYQKAILGGLRNEPLRITLCEMLYGGNRESTFSGRSEEFGAEMERLYVSGFGKELRYGIEVSTRKSPNPGGRADG